MWCEIDGRYRVDGGSSRRDIVIPRTRQKLIRLQAVRVGYGSHPDLYITEVGRALIRRYEFDALVSRRKGK